MSPRASRKFPSRLFRGLIGSVMLLWASGLATSCLTPHFDFGDGSVGLGGDGPVDRCENRQIDEGETDIDCGGPCPQCPIGSPCVITRDCEPPPAEDPAVVQCLDGVCTLDCQRDYADCNGRASDGCEANLLSDLYNCGTCKMECAPDHAEGQCVNGECLINTQAENQGCKNGFANCNLEADDGCEIDLSSDPDHCGACEDSICSDANGEPSCDAGACAIKCADGYKNCDKDARSNGCEIHTASSTKDCGECDYECPSSGADWFPYCKEGTCGETECTNGMGDCDGDGSCTDSLSSVEHCGGCGLLCFVPNGTPACENDKCTIDSCGTDDDGTWADCDSDYTTGCEVNTRTSRLRCGGCLSEEGGNGEDCSKKEGTQHVTVTTCGDGKCAVVSCDSGWVDCDGTFSNGCEIDTANDEDNCGGCASSGGEVCVNKAHTASECMGGSCDYSCDDGWSDYNGDRYEENSNGCESRTLSLVNAGSWDSSDTGGSGPGVTINHVLEGTQGTQRLVLVGVICRGGSIADCAMTTATYNGIALRRLDSSNNVFDTDTDVKIFYLLDADLPAPGTYPVIINRNDEWGSLSVEVVEFRGAEQDTFYADIATATKDALCDAGADAAVQLKSLPPGSAVYAVGGGHHQSTSTSGVSAAAPLKISVAEIDDYIVFGSEYGENLSGNVDVTLNFTGCYRSVLYAVGVRPESNY